MFVLLKGEDPGFKGDLRRNPYLGHHNQHPDRTSDPGTRHLRSLEGKEPECREP